MAENEIESDSSEDYVDASDNPIWYSDEMYGITKDMILKNKELLTDRLQDTKYGILDKLVANDGLTYQETIAIDKCSTNPCDKTRKLIDVVLEKNTLTQFIKALVDTDQKHLVNYLRGNGVFNAEFGDDWPLGQDRIKQLDMNREYLIDKIDSGLIRKLWSAKVISERQYSFICHEKNPCEVNSVLLDVIRRQSLKQYDGTIVCLNKSRQYHIAEILKRTGVIQKIHVSQEGDPEIVNATEDALSNRFADSLRDLSIEDAQRVLEMTHLKILDAKKNGSIYLYVYIETLQELMTLNNLLVNGDMKTIVETLFNKLVSRQDPIVVSCTYSKDEFDICKSYFEEMTEGGEQEMPSIGPGTDQSPYGISSVPGMAEGGEEQMPLIGYGTAQRRSFPVEINEHALNNVAIPEIRKVLVGRMNTNFGLLDKLLASKALSRSDITDVLELSSSHEKNTRLLELVSKKDKLAEFFNALKDTHQDHLVNYVTAKGEYNQDYGGAWPLTEREIAILDVNQESLVELLDFTGDEIINKLYKANVLNRRQKEFIGKRSCDYEKAEVLLDFLHRSSMSDYWKMITCLTATNQQHAAKLLLEGGALVRVHNTVVLEAEEATAAENEIVTKIESILSDMNLEEPSSNRILERLQLKLFAARVGH